MPHRSVDATNTPLIRGFCKITVHLRTTPPSNQQPGDDFFSFVFVSKYDSVPNSQEQPPKAGESLFQLHLLLNFSRDVSNLKSVFAIKL